MMAAGQRVRRSAVLPQCVIPVQMSRSAGDEPLGEALMAGNIFRALRYDSQLDRGRWGGAAPTALPILFANFPSPYGLG